MTTEIKSISDRLDTPKIEIVEKKACIESKTRTVEYVFGLNSGVDSIWLAIFNSELRILPSGINRADLKVEIRGAELHLHCLAANLESKYPVVKAAIERTNGKYPQHREEALKKITAQKNESRREEEAKKKQSEAVKNQFDRFQV